MMEDHLSSPLMYMEGSFSTPIFFRPRNVLFDSVFVNRNIDGVSEFFFSLHGGGHHICEAAQVAGTSVKTSTSGFFSAGVVRQFDVQRVV